MPFIDFSAFNGSKIDKPFEREIKFLLSPDIDPSVKDFTFLLSTLAPHGGCTDYHTHADAGEIMIFMSGKGKAWLDGVEHDLKPGAAMYAPPGTIHKTMNTGSEPLQIACVFVPAISTDYIRQNIEAAQTKKGAADE
ncbi:MAG TPA: cupin domain-containing protein [Spirochaetota bacterium]|nr:cupin domain-containing protein [Spirochaetota bacterium]